MTNEEAIAYLERADSTVYKKIKTKTAEALEMAIQALEQQPFINKPCVSEGICREDKIQVLDKIRAEIIELRSKQNVGVMECLDIIDKYKVESEDVE